MAIVWQKNTRTATYEVRSAGRTKRLYRNSVLHSQWNPARPLNGSFWELFLLASFGLARRPVRVLLLGVGGGAVIQLFSRFNNAKHDLKIVGVEIDPNHLQVAKKYFKVDGKVCELHLYDAVDWVDQYSGDQFDLIIDDLFIEWGKQPQRVSMTPSLWYRKLNSLLNPQGGLVINFADDLEWRHFRSAIRQSVSRSASYALSFRHLQCQNRVVLFAKQPLSSVSLRARLVASEAKKMMDSIKDKTFVVRALRL